MPDKQKIGLKSELDDADFRKGVENYSKSLDNMNSQTGSIAGSLTSAFGTVATGVLGATAIIGTALVASLAAFGAAAFSAGQTFDDAFDEIVIKTGATGPVLEQLQSDFKDVFTSIPTDATTASSVIGTLNARLGLTGESLTSVAEPLLEVTRMLGGDATTNTELFTRVMGDWSISNEDASKALDTMFVATQETGIGLDKLMGNVVQFGSPLRLMGFSLNESVAMFAKWEAEGVNAELVMGSLRIAAGKFAEQGVSLSDGLWKSYDAIKNETDASKALSIAMDVFGARAGPDMAAAIREGRFEIEDLMTAMEGADGAIMSTAESTEGIAEKMKLLKNNAITALEPVGTAFLGVAAGVLDGLMPALQTLSGIFTTTIAPAIAGAMPGITNFIQNGLAKMTEWLQVWLPIAIQNVSAFWTNTLQPALATVWNFVITSLIPALGNIWNFLATIIPPALTFLSSVWTNVLQPAIAAVWSFLSTVVIPFLQNTVFPWLQENIPIALQTLSDFWTNVLQPAVAAVWSWLSTTLIPFLTNTLFPWLQENIPKALQTLSDFWTNTLKPAIEKVWEWISGTLVPFFQNTLQPIIQTTIPNAIQTLSDFWTNTLLPAITDIYNFFTENILPIIQDVIDIMDKVSGIVGTAFAGFWDKVLQPALETVYNFFNDHIMPILSDVMEFIRDEIGPKVKWLADEVFTPLANTLEGGVKRALEWLSGILDKIKKFLDNFELPDWLTPGSPTPFEMGLRGIAEALTVVNDAMGDSVSKYAALGKISLGGTVMNAAHQPVSAMQMAIRGAAAPAGAVPAITNNNQRMLNLNMGGVTMQNNMDMAMLRSLIIQTVHESFAGV